MMTRFSMIGCSRACALPIRDRSDRALMRRYSDRVPDMAYRDSCIFHGKQGCTLDRSMRADVCNTDYCGGLGTFMKSKDASRPEPWSSPVRAIRCARRLFFRRKGTCRAVARERDSAIRPAARCLKLLSLDRLGHRRPLCACNKDHQPGQCQR